MEPKHTIFIETEIDPELQGIIEGKASPEVYRALSERVNDLPDMVSVYTEQRATGGALDLRVVLKPSKALLDLVAAITA